jgi:hypothetical protein
MSKQPKIIENNNTLPPVALKMNFDEALKKALFTPLPKKKAAKKKA